MCRISQALLFFLLIIYTGKSAEPYNNIGGTTSGVAILYKSTVQIPQRELRSYNITYTTPKTSNPKLIYGIAGYERHRDMYQSYFNMVLHINTLSYFSINFTTDIDFIYMVTLAYISLDDIYGAFYSLPIQYNPLTIVSGGNSYRTEAINTNFYAISENSNYSLSKIYTFLTGIKIYSVDGDYNFYISVNIDNNTNIGDNKITFTTTITTDGTCQIMYVQAMHLIVDQSKYGAYQILIYGVDYNFMDSSSMGPPPHYTSLGNTMLALSGWNGLANDISSNLSFGYVLNTTNWDVTMDNTILNNVRLLYLYMALEQCPSAYPYYQTSSKIACITQCQADEIQSPTNKICSACTAPCISCQGIATNCTSCNTGYHVASGTCQKDQTQPIAQTKNTNNSQHLYLLALLAIIPISVVRNNILYASQQYLFVSNDEALQSKERIQSCSHPSTLLESFQYFLI